MIIRELPVDLLLAWTHQGWELGLPDGLRVSRVIPLNSPTYSVVLTTYTVRRSHWLMAAIASAAGQQPPPLEVVVVVEADRRLEETVKQSAPRFPVIVRTIFNEGVPGMSSARNLGAEAACGDIVAFLDDDAAARCGWAAAIVREFHEHESTVVVTGPAEPWWEDDSLSWVPPEFHWLLGCTSFVRWKERRVVRNGWGMNMAVRRGDFLACGGFRIQFGLSNSARRSFADPPSEDVDISMRMRQMTGRNVVYLPGARVRHRVTSARLAPRSIVQRSYSVGSQRRAIQQLYKRSEGPEDLLRVEHNLLRALVIDFFPRVSRHAVTQPKLAIRESTLALLSLSAVGAGYLVATVSGVVTKNKEA